MIQRLVSSFLSLLHFHYPLPPALLSAERGKVQVGGGRAPRLLALGLGKIEVIMFFGKGRKKLRLSVFWSDHKCGKGDCIFTHENPPERIVFLFALPGLLQFPGPFVKPVLPHLHQYAPAPMLHVHEQVAHYLEARQ